MITGLVLAGGKSTRMGRNKALIEVDGRRVISRVVDVLSECCSKVLVVCASEDDYGFVDVPVVRDIEPGQGPFMGLYSGLAGMDTDYALAAACDMPYISKPLACHMAGLAPSADIVVPRIGDFYEPLFATYSKACLNTSRKLLQNGEKRIRMLYEIMETRTVEEDEIKKFDPELQTFINLNSPGDLDKLSS